MKSWITYITKIVIVLILPILFFDVFTSKYPYELKGQEIIQDAQAMYDLYHDAYIGSDKHREFQKDLIKTLEDMGYTVHLQAYQQLGTIVGQEYSLSVDGTDYVLGPVRGGRAIGTSFEGEVVLLNSATSFTEDLVKDRFVMLTNHGNVEDPVFEALYNYGCKGVLLGTATYPDGFENFDISRLDGRMIPIAMTNDALNDHLIELSKASQNNPRQISIGISYSNVDYFQGGVIENVSINIDQSIELIEGTNIIASLSEDKTSQIIATSYDPKPASQSVGIYYNMLSLSTVIKMADAAKDSDADITFALFDGGSAGQMGAKYYRENSFYPNTPILFIENIGFVKHHMFSKGEASQFETEKIIQYSKGGLSHSTYNGFDQMMLNQAAYTYLLNEEQVAAITYSPTSNLYSIFQDPLTEENFGGLLETLDQYLKVELYKDHSQDLPAYFIIFLIGIIAYILIVLSLEQFKDQALIHRVYNTHAYKIFINITNIMGVFLVTLLVILLIALLPEYFNMSGGRANYSLYTLSKEILFLFDNFVHNGFGHSTMGIPYIETIIQSSMVSFKLVMIAMTVSILLGLAIGILSTYRKKANKSQSVWVILGLSIPETVIIIGLLFSMKYMVEWPLIKDYLESSQLRAFVLPLISMMVVPTIYISRLVYIEVIELLQKKFVLSLKAKGVKKNRIYSHHILPIAFQKVLNTIPIILAINISTMIIAEKLFAVPGIINQIFAALDHGIYLYYLGLVLSLMSFYYLVVLSAKLINRLLIPNGGANESK